MPFPLTSPHSPLSLCPLTCLPCTKTLVILGARLSTSLVKRLAARRTTDLVGEKTQEQSCNQVQFFNLLQILQWVENRLWKMRGSWDPSEIHFGIMCRIDSALRKIRVGV